MATNCICHQFLFSTFVWLLQMYQPYKCTAMSNTAHGEWITELVCCIQTIGSYRPIVCWSWQASTNLNTEILLGILRRFRDAFNFHGKIKMFNIARILLLLCLGRNRLLIADGNIAYYFASSEVEHLHLFLQEALFYFRWPSVSEPLRKIFW